MDEHLQLSVNDICAAKNLDDPKEIGVGGDRSAVIQDRVAPKDNLKAVSESPSHPRR
jgi:hypothetical protein